MSISMSSPTSGFRKWSEAHDPKITAARAAATKVAVIPVPDPDQGISDFRRTAASSVARAGGRYALKRTPIAFLVTSFALARLPKPSLMQFRPDC